MKAAELASKALAALAAAFLGAMMLLTAADVVMRWTLGRPIHGTFELIELGLACAVFLALPAVFLRDENLVVDAIDAVAKPSTVRRLDLAGAVLSLLTLAAMLYSMVPLARDMYELGDVTADLSIPKTVYWVPVLLGVLGSLLMTIVYIVRWRARP
ncbi:MAG: TRAP transporter small permease [Betaproteobacteria bacterium]|nr:TRAP transporter small permease [Betaproteobacteria bacterium]